MPYRSNKGAYQAYRRNPSYYNKRIKSKAEQALSLARATRKLLNVEFFFHDANVAINPDSSGLISELTLIAQGDTVSTRTGNSLLAKSLMLRGTDTVSAAALTPTVVRHIIFKDTMNLGVAPTVANVLAATVSVNSNLNIEDFPKRFVPLRDWTINLPVPSDQDESVSWKQYVKLNHHIKYDGAAGTAATQRSGGIYHLTISNQSTNDPAVGANSRFRFIDN